MKKIYVLCLSFMVMVVLGCSQESQSGFASKKNEVESQEAKQMYGSYTCQERWNNLVKFLTVGTSIYEKFVFAGSEFLGNEAANYLSQKKSAGKVIKNDGKSIKFDQGDIEITGFGLNFNKDEYINGCNNPQGSISYLSTSSAKFFGKTYKTVRAKISAQGTSMYITLIIENNLPTKIEYDSSSGLGGSGIEYSYER